MKALTPKKNPAPLLITNGASTEPTRDKIAYCAYSIWEKEGRPPGRDVEHWMQAETQLRQAHSQAAPRV